MIIKNIEITVLTVSLITSIAAFALSVRDNARARSQYVAALRREWEDLYSEWVMALLIARGWDDYYSEATLKQRAQVREIMHGATDQDLDVTDRTNELRELTAAVRKTVRFLAYTSDLVLSGRITPQDAYRLFGPDVSRHGAAIRWMSGAGDLPPTHLDEWALDAFQIPNSDFFGEQELVFALVDLLWAETARYGDNSVHSLMAVAQHKRYITGKFCRARVRRLVWQRTGNPVLAIRMAHRLRTAEFISVRNLLREDRMSFPNFIDENCVQQGTVPFIRTFRGRRFVRRWKANQWSSQ